MGEINLRPHHFKVVLQYFSGTEQQREGFLDVCRREYGDSFVEHAVRLFERIEGGELVRIVSGEDDICGIPCKFLESCRAGDYTPLVDAVFRGAGAKGFVTPEVADQVVVKSLGLIIGKSYACHYMEVPDVPEKQHI